MNVDNIIATIDRAKFSDIVARYGDDPGPTGERRNKYLALPLWIRTNLRRAQRLGLDAGPHRRILDIGCGCGYFLYVCGLLGHEVLGIDRAERKSLFTEMRDLLGVPWVAHSVRALEPLPDLGRFDVVTAHMVTFNGHRTDRVWGPHEWQSLLDSIAAPTVYLELNMEPDGVLFPSGVRELFLQHGAQIDQHRVVIRR